MYCAHMHNPCNSIRCLQHAGTTYPKSSPPSLLRGHGLGAPATEAMSAIEVAPSPAHGEELMPAIHSLHARVRGLGDVEAACPHVCVLRGRFMMLSRQHVTPLNHTGLMAFSAMRIQLHFHSQFALIVFRGRSLRHVASGPCSGPAGCACFFFYLSTLTLLSLHDATPPLLYPPA
jgi:hypothetical protein